MLTLLLTLAITAPPEGFTLPVKVVEVYDGDTITVEYTIRARVRLLDCWAPEVRGEGKAAGIVSRDYLRALIDGKQALLHVPTKGRKRLDNVFTFGRLLGRVYVGDEDIGARMVRDGYATREKVKQ